MIYAGFVNKKIAEYYRTTHNKVIVPHVPPIEGFGYKHSCREIFEDSTRKLNVCSATNCEDPKCAHQFSLVQTNEDDHSIAFLVKKVLYRAIIISLFSYFTLYLLSS